MKEFMLILTRDTLQILHLVKEVDKLFIVKVQFKAKALSSEDRWLKGSCLLSWWGELSKRPILGKRGRAKQYTRATSLLLALRRALQ